jgi:hypothetical protein
MYMGGAIKEHDIFGFHMYMGGAIKEQCFLEDYC